MPTPYFINYFLYKYTIMLNIRRKDILYPVRFCRFCQMEQMQRHERLYHHPYTSEVGMHRIRISGLLLYPDLHQGSQYPLRCLPSEYHDMAPTLGNHLLPDVRTALRTLHRYAERMDQGRDQQHMYKGYDRWPTYRSQHLLHDAQRTILHLRWKVPGCMRSNHHSHPSVCVYLYLTVPSHHL